MQQERDRNEIGKHSIRTTQNVGLSINKTMEKTTLFINENAVDCASDHGHQY